MGSSSEQPPVPPALSPYGPALNAMNHHTPGMSRPMRRGLLAAGLGGAVALIVVLVFLSSQLLATSGSGWSKEVVFDDGRDGPLVDMRLAFRSEPQPAVVGVQKMMFRVKSVAGYPMLVTPVRYSIQKRGEAAGRTGEAKPVGDFGLTGNGTGFYTADVPLGAPGQYTVQLTVPNGLATIETSWTLDVVAS